MTKPEQWTSEEWLAALDGHNPSEAIQQPIVTKDGDGCAIEAEPLIPEDKYKVAYLEHGTVNVPGTGKLVIQFTIVAGAYQGTILKAYYRVKLKRPIGKCGKFVPSRQGEYYEQMCDIFPDLIEGRTDRISPQRLKGKTILVEVTTVKTKWNGKQRKKHTQYSKVNRMVSLD